MDISLPHNMENILKTKVAEGVFSTMDEAVTFAIQFAFFENNGLEERVAALNDEIQKGIDDYEAVRYQEGQSAFNKLLKKYE